MGVRVIRNRGEIVLAINGFTVQRFDIFEHVPERDRGRPHFLGGEAIEHKRII
jgi:hypothetical protein